MNKQHTTTRAAHNNNESLSVLGSGVFTMTKEETTVALLPDTLDGVLIATGDDELASGANDKVAGVHRDTDSALDHIKDLNTSIIRVSV